MSDFDNFFGAAIGLDRDQSSDASTFDDQRKLALRPLADLLNVPTGLGKTAAVTRADWCVRSKEQR